MIIGMQTYIRSLKDPRKLLKLIGLLSVVVVLPLGLFSISATADFENFVRSIGPWGPVVVTLYIMFSHVFVPVVGSPMAILSFTMYGIPATMLYMYIGGLMSAVINYWLAHVYGRKLVLKFAGVKTMTQIDHYAEHMGAKVLIFARLFAGSLFDVISYAAGITSMPFKQYYAITVFYSGISSIITAYLFRDFNFKSPLMVFEWIGALIVLGAVFGFTFNRMLPYLKEKKQSDETLVTKDNDQPVTPS